MAASQLLPLFIFTYLFIYIGWIFLLLILSQQKININIKKHDTKTLQTYSILRVVLGNIAEELSQCENVRCKATLLIFILNELCYEKYDHLRLLNSNITFVCDEPALHRLTTSKHNAGSFDLSQTRWHQQ